MRAKRFPAGSDAFTHDRSCDDDDHTHVSRANAILRSTLLQRLDAATFDRVILVEGAAGSGKTVLLEQFERYTNRRTRFAALHGCSRPIECAIRSTSDSSGDAKSQGAQCTKDLSPYSIEELTNELGNFDGVFVLDDFHTAEAGSATDINISNLIESTPRTCWLISTRFSEPIPRSLWINKGWLREIISAQELFFDRSECDAFAKSMSSNDCIVDADAIYSMTFGWPIAFAMACRRASVSSGRTPGSLTILEGSIRDTNFAALSASLARADLQLIFRCCLNDDLDLASIYAVFSVDAEACITLFKQHPLIKRLSSGSFVMAMSYRQHLLELIRFESDSNQYDILLANCTLARAQGRLRQFLESLSPDDFAQSCLMRLLDELCDEIIDQGLTFAGRRIVAAITVLGRERSSKCLLINAVLAEQEGDHLQSTVLYRRSVNAARQTNDKLIVLNTWALRIARHHYWGVHDQIDHIVDEYRRVLGGDALNREHRYAGLIILDLIKTRSKAHGYSMFEPIPDSLNYGHQATVSLTTAWHHFSLGEYEEAQHHAQIATGYASSGSHHLLVADTKLLLALLRLEGGAARKDVADLIVDVYEAFDDLGDKLSACLCSLLLLDTYALASNDSPAIMKRCVELSQRDLALPRRFSYLETMVRASLEASRGHFAEALRLIRSVSALSVPVHLRLRYRMQERFIQCIYAPNGVDREAFAFDVKELSRVNIRDRTTFDLLIKALIASTILNQKDVARGVLREIASQHRMRAYERECFAAARTVCVALRFGDQVELAKGVETLCSSDPVLIYQALRHFRPHAMPQSNISLLTQAERLVLRHLCEGFTSSQVANKLGRSTNTVNVHISSIIRKLKCTNRREAIMFARDDGLL